MYTDYFYPTYTPQGTFLVTQAAMNALLAHGGQGGAVVNVSSISGKKGNYGQANYAASKAGVEAFTRTAAIEFGK